MPGKVKFAEQGSGLPESAPKMATDSGKIEVVKADAKAMPKKEMVANAKAHVVVDGSMPQEERTRLAAMIGNANAQDTRAFVGQEGKVQIVDDYHNKATLVFQDCKDCEYTLTEICTKVFVQNCENLTLTINATVVTSAVEAYKTKGLKIHANKRVQMFQADICEDVHAIFKEKDHFNFAVWAGTQNLKITVGDDEHHTGYDQMASRDKTLVFERTQFKTWYVGSKIQTEKVVRLDNGYPTTQRERNIFEARQEENMRKLAADMFGDLKLTVPKKKREGPKVGRNDKCLCDSGKKFKSCCGVAGASSGLDYKEPI